MTAQREWFEKDFYAALGVSDGSSDKEISKAYKKLAKQFHPDANAGDTAAEERFKEISAAYDVLGNAEQRREYDDVRRMVAAGVAGPGAGRPGTRGYGGFGPEGVHFSFEEGDLGDLGGIFGQFFDQGAAGGRRPRMAAHGRDVEAAVTVDFMEAIEGTTKTVRFQIDAAGPTNEVKLKVPRGIENGKRLRVAGRGEPGMGGGAPGDLYVIVHVLPHARFGREGADLTLDVPISFPEAALGAAVRVPTLDGSVKIRVPPGTQSNKVLRVRGKGVLDGAGNVGDLLVTLNVAVPTDLSDDARAAIDELAAVLGDSPRDVLDGAAG